MTVSVVAILLFIFIFIVIVLLIFVVIVAFTVSSLFLSITINFAVYINLHVLFVGRVELLFFLSRSLVRFFGRQRCRECTVALGVVRRIRLGHVVTNGLAHTLCVVVYL
jgi:hypothetical protein